MKMRNNYELKQDAIELKLINKARKAQRKCFYPECPNYAINSHILQENGILNQIAENGKFMEYSRNTPFNPADFRLTGINASEMFTFKGFCSTHDTSIFNEVENGMCNFVEHRHQLLFAYRGLLNDLFKAQVVTDYFNYVFQDKNISFQRKEMFKLNRAFRLRAVKETQYYKMLLEKELFNSSTKTNFIFHRFELPRIEIATSTIYASGVHEIFDYDEISSIDPTSDKYTPMSKPLFINLIPRNDSLVIIIGHPITTDSIESIPINNIAGLSENGILKLLSHILIKIETWGMSPTFHNKLKTQGKLDQYFAIRNEWLLNRHQLVPLPLPKNYVPINYIPEEFNLFRIQPSEFLGRQIIQNIR
jgi:hypothetical protein